jgi:hypothetical protein
MGKTAAQCSSKSLLIVRQSCVLLSKRGMRLLQGVVSWPGRAAVHCRGNKPRALLAAKRERSLSSKVNVAALDLDVVLPVSPQTEAATCRNETAVQRGRWGRGGRLVEYSQW